MQYPLTLFTMLCRQSLLLPYIFLSIFFWLSGTIVSQELSAQISPIAATHESKILLVIQYEQHIYSLDDKSLLKIQNINTTSSDTTKTIFIGREKLNSAYFHYPFIITETAHKSIILYNIIEQKNLYTFPSDGHSSAISNDSTLFSFSYKSNIVIIDLINRNIINSIPFNKSIYPLFIILAANNKNIMIYYSNGTIEYRQINTKKVLKRIKNDNQILALALNKNRRYIIGYNDNNLISIDAINGTTISNYFFFDTIKQIKISHSANTVLVISEDSNAIQSISFYTILQNGKLIIDDTIQISGLDKISSISQTKDLTLFVGKTDGSIFMYKNKENILSLLYPNTTQAIYDASIFNSSLVIAKSNSLVHFPLSTIITKSNKQLHNKINKKNSTYHEIEYSPNIFLQYENPSFIIPNNLTEDSNNSVYILSKNETNPLLYILDENFSLIKVDTLQFIPDLLFIPNNKHIFYYQKQKSFLVSRINTRETNISLDTNQLLYTLQYHTNITQNSSPLLWLNTPIYQTKNINNTITELKLWAYPLENIQQISPLSNKNTDASNNANTILSQVDTLNTSNIQSNTSNPSIQFPFNSKNVLYIQAINTMNRNSFFIVINTELPSNNTFIDNNAKFPYQNIHISTLGYTVHLATENITQKNTSNSFSLINIPLTNINYDEVLFILPYGDNKETLLIFTKQYIRIITINTNTVNLSLDIHTKYPDNFGIIRNVGIYDNYIVMVDVHNSLIILEIQENNIIEKVAQLFLSENIVHIQNFQ